MRGKQAKKREIKPDLMYNNVSVTRLINKVMLRGKKNTARKIVYTSLENLAKETKTDTIEAFEKALNNVRPEVEVRSRRIGGANYQIPMPVADTRQTSVAIRWIVDAARGQKGSDMTTSLSKELLNAYNNTGSANKKKEETLRMAEANKAFSHFAIQ
jgi:small subunit ribosomal protein S7